MTLGWAHVGLLAIAGGFVALAWPGAAERGIIAEEIQPYLTRHARVLTLDEGDVIAALPPYEPGAPAGPRWVATPAWPVLAFDGTRRQWPLVISGHQTAIGSYLGIALGPLLGGGIAGVRRSTVFLGLALIVLTFLCLRRSSDSAAEPLLAALLLASSFGTVWISGTGYAFEVFSRVAMMAALAVAAPTRPPSARRALAIGLLSAVAILGRATIAITLLPALAILLAHPARRPGRAAAGLLAATAITLPLAAFACVSLLAPHAASLAEVPLDQVWSRTAHAPGQLVLQLAWLVDSNTVLAPLMRGQAELGALWPFAALGALPLLVALVRWWNGKASDGERMFVCAVLAGVLAGAWLYRSPRQFQLALALEPLAALAVAQQLSALRRRGPRVALAVLLLLVALRGQSLALGLHARAHSGNPMLSGQVQRLALARLRALDIKGPELITTTYNQAGVIEAASDGAIRPLHGWRVLSRGHSSGSGDRPLPWRAILRQLHPRFVLLSDGTNLFDGPFTDTPATEAQLLKAAAETGLSVEVDSRFATERGTPGWTLLRLR